MYLREQASRRPIVKTTLKSEQQTWRSWKIISLSICSGRASLPVVLRCATTCLSLAILSNTGGKSLCTEATLCFSTLIQSWMNSAAASKLSKLSKALTNWKLVHSWSEAGIESRALGISRAMFPWVAMRQSNFCESGLGLQDTCYGVQLCETWC